MRVTTILFILRTAYGDRSSPIPQRIMRLLQTIKSMVVQQPSDAGTVIASSDAIDHPFLGCLRPESKHSDTLVAQIPCAGGKVQLRVSPDGRTMGEALALASAAVARLLELDAKCRELIAADNLDEYNSAWRYGERALKDGTVERVKRPRLSKSEFCAKLKFESLDASGSNLLAFWYGDGGMFWGHNLYVTSLDGVNLGDVRVSMFG